MQLRSGRKLDIIQPNIGTVFDPGLDVATLVFSHVQCVETRFNLALVSKLWREASKPAAAYPSRFDLSKLRRVTRFSWQGDSYPWQQPAFNSDIACLMDNDGVLSLPLDRVFQLLRESFSVHCYETYRPVVIRAPLSNRWPWGSQIVRFEAPPSFDPFQNVPKWLCRYGFKTGRVRLIKLGSSGRFHNLLK